MAKMDCYWRKRVGCDLWDFWCVDGESNHKFTLMTMSKPLQNYNLDCPLLGIYRTFPVASLNDAKIDAEMTLLEQINYYSSELARIKKAVIKQSDPQKWKYKEDAWR